MQFFTGTGDKGDTGLVDGSRVKKNSLRIEAIGNIDELNSLVGIISARNKNKKIEKILTQIQNDLFVAGSEIASPQNKTKIKIPILNAENVKRIEDFVNEIGNQLEPLNKFILPGRSVDSALIHNIRAVCRRTERSIVALDEKEKINEEILKYVNRLSSLLFILARYANKISNIKEKEWNNNGKSKS